MNINDTVYLQWRGQWTEFTLKRLHDWQNTCTVVNGNGEHTCKVSELIGKERYDEMVRDAHKADLRTLHSGLIERWGNGPEKPTKAAWKRLVSTIAKELGRTPSGLGTTIAMLVRWGVINDNRTSRTNSDSGGQSPSERASELPADSGGV